MIGLAAALVAALFGYLIFTAQHRDRVAMEYEAARAAYLVFETYDAGGTVDESMLPSAVLAFGVYDVNGEAIFRIGEVPELLNPEHTPLKATGWTILQGNVLRIIRPVGSLEVLQTLPNRDAKLRASEPPHGHMNSAMPDRPHAVLLDYDVASQMRRSAFRRYAWIAAALLMAALGGLLFMLSRRLRRFEDEAERQERLVQLGHAARTLTHEIKNPLGSIQLQVSLLRRELNEDHAEKLDVLVEETQRIDTLVERVRDFLHSSPGRVEELDIAALGRELPDRFEFPVIVHTPSESLTVHTDRDRMRSVLTNLIQNAHESMQERNPQAAVEVTIRGRKNEVIIQVDDAGPGIPPAERSRIFDPFYTTKPRGSGVGLAITKQFVDAMGGSIAVADRPGGGTRVKIVLKRQQERT